MISRNWMDFAETRLINFTPPTDTTISFETRNQLSEKQMRTNSIEK